MFHTDMAESMWLKKHRRIVLKTVNTGQIYVGCSELYLIATIKKVKHYSKMPIDVIFGKKKIYLVKVLMYSNEILFDLEGQTASAFLDKKWKILAKVVHYY